MADLLCVVGQFVQRANNNPDAAAAGGIAPPGTVSYRGALRQQCFQTILTYSGLVLVNLFYFFNEPLYFVLFEVK